MNGARVQCGRPGSVRDGTYMDRVDGRHPDGRLRLKLRGRHAMSLIQRQTESQNSEEGGLGLVHAKNWKLPKTSWAAAQQIAAHYPQTSELASVTRNTQSILDLREAGRIRPGQNLWKTAYIKTLDDKPATASDDGFPFPPLGRTL